MRRLRRYQPRSLQAIQAVRAEINVTPLVDVVLVLLIIFMVVTPMLQRGIDVALPEAARAKETRDTGERVVISVRRDGAVFLDRAEVALDRLGHYLGRMAGRSILLKADQSLTYGQVRRVMEMCHHAGVSQVALATENQR